MWYYSGMVAIRFTCEERAADGLMILVRRGTVRGLRGGVYICREDALAALDANGIGYERLPLPLELNEVDTVRNTLTTAL